MTDHRPEVREVVSKLVEALQAQITMRDMKKPTKLVEELSWRENDEYAAKLADEALKQATTYISAPPIEPVGVREALEGFLNFRLCSTFDAKGTYTRERAEALHVLQQQAQAALAAIESILERKRKI